MPREAEPRLVLGAADAELAVGELRRRVDDLREAHDGDHVVVGHLAPVDLLEEVLHLLVAAELGVVVLDVARRELLEPLDVDLVDDRDRKSTRLNSSHANISYAVFCLKKKKK